jgi:hypothetical protein
MLSGAAHSPARLVEYDSLHRRVWIFGQRLHHGATGALVAAGAALTLLVDPAPLPVVALAAGGALMLHDWKDRSIWFKPGHGPQP